MAIEKDIAIHGSSGISQCIDYVVDKEKTDVTGFPASDINNLLSYAENLEKTVFSLDGETSILVSGVNCSELTAPEDFARTHDKYEQHYANLKKHGTGGTKTVYDPATGAARTVAKESIEAYHVIQSFPALDGLDPRLVHKIGIEYAKAAFPNHQCVVSTHMNTDNLHNHIVVCAYEMDNPKKLAMNKTFRRHIRHINDEISLKYNLPILIGNEIGSNLSMSKGECYAKSYGLSFKDQLRNDITTALSKDYVSSWDDFKLQMESLGYTVKETPKNVTYIKTDKDKTGKEVTHRCRENKLGQEYEKQHICRSKDWKTASSTHLSYWELERLNDFNKNSSQSDFVGHKKKDGLFHIHISRYDDNGIRRSDLEMLFLIAINVINYLWNQLVEKHQGKNVIPDKNHDPRLMVKTLSDCMKLAKVLNINSLDELNNRRNEVGKNISINRKELEIAKNISAAYFKLAGKVQEYKLLSKELSSKGISIEDYHLITPTKRDASFAIAKIIPMTASQRRELFLSLGKVGDTWRLDCKYEDISYMTAINIFDFLNGKTDKKPDVLITVDEFNKKREALRREASIGNPGQVTEKIHKDMKDSAFDKLLSSYPPDVTVTLSRCRTLLQELMNLGYSPDTLNSLLKESLSYQHDYNVLKDKASLLNAEYKNLCRLDDGIKLAKENSFTNEIIKKQSNENKHASSVDDSIDIAYDSLSSYLGH